MPRYFIEDCLLLTPNTARTSVPVTKSIQRPVSTSRKKTDEQLFEFLNSGPSSLATAEKRAPQFTSTPVKQKSSQNAQQPDDQTGVVFKSEKTMPTDKGELPVQRYFISSMP